MTTYRVGYLVGSLAKASINRKLALGLTRVAPPELNLREIPFGDLPLYNYELEQEFPAAARAFKDAIGAVDAVLFVTPEYNRSIPGVLKNAIDCGSRPYGDSAWTAIAQQHLRSILAYCNSPLLNSVEAYIQFTPGLIGDGGEVTDPKIGEFLKNYMAEFYGFIARVYSVLPRTA